MDMVNAQCIFLSFALVVRVVISSPGSVEHSILMFNGVRRVVHASRRPPGQPQGIMALK